MWLCSPTNVLTSWCLQRSHSAQLFVATLVQYFRSNIAASKLNQRANDETPVVGVDKVRIRATDLAGCGIHLRPIASCRVRSDSAGMDSTAVDGPVASQMV